MPSRRIPIRGDVRTGCRLFAVADALLLVACPMQRIGVDSLG